MQAFCVGCSATCLPATREPCQVLNSVPPARSPACQVSTLNIYIDGPLYPSVLRETRLKGKFRSRRNLQLGLLSSVLPLAPRGCNVKARLGTHRLQRGKDTFNVDAFELSKAKHHRTRRTAVRHRRFRRPPPRYLSCESTNSVVADDSATASPNATIRSALESTIAALREALIRSTAVLSSVVSAKLLSTRAASHPISIISASVTRIAYRRGFCSPVRDRIPIECCSPTPVLCTDEQGPTPATWP